MCDRRKFSESTAVVASYHFGGMMMVPHGGYTLYSKTSLYSSLQSGTYMVSF